MPHQLVVISGPPNAGKSSTAEALCQRYDRMLHIDVGVLRDFLRMGRLRPWDDSADGRRQRALLIASACDMARRFLDATYGVIIDDIVLPEDVPLYHDALAVANYDVIFVVLRPEWDVIAAREEQRPTEWHRGGHLEAVYRVFEGWPDVAGIDPNNLAPDLVADRVMALAAEGRARLPSGALGA